MLKSYSQVFIPKLSIQKSDLPSTKNAIPVFNNLTNNLNDFSSFQAIF